MYLGVYGLRNAGLTDHLATLLDRFAQSGVRETNRRDRSPRRFALVSDEHHADPVGGGAVDRRDARHGRDDLRQPDRLRSWPKNHVDRIARDATVAARARTEGHPHRMGLLFPRRFMLTIPILLITLAALALRTGIC